MHLQIYYNQYIKKGEETERGKKYEKIINGIKILSNSKDISDLYAFYFVTGYVHTWHYFNESAKETLNYSNK